MAVEIQQNPDDFHDASEHRYDPDENGVCRVCGWWDPNGEICPSCGEPWDDHPTVEVHIDVFLVEDEASHLMRGTSFSKN